MSDIAACLRAILDRHGRESVGWYMGNPGAFSYSHTLWVKGFLDGIGSPHYYSAGSQDVNNRFAASARCTGRRCCPDPRPEPHRLPVRWSVRTCSSRTGPCCPRRVRASS